MKFKEKTTTVAITDRSRKIIKVLTKQIFEKTGTHVSVAEFIEEFLSKDGEALKNKIIEDYEKNEVKI